VILAKARQFDAKDVVTDPDSGSNASDDTMLSVLEDHADEPVRTGHLPPHAQDIYREAFNHAFASHAGDVRQEEIAHRTAWSAVKRSYVKMGDQWVTLDKRHQG
jgi:cation transport regulator